MQSPVSVVADADRRPTTLWPPRWAGCVVCRRVYPRLLFSPFNRWIRVADQDQREALPSGARPARIAPVGKQWAWWDLNPRPPAYKTDALTD